MKFHSAVALFLLSLATLLTACSGSHDIVITIKFDDAGRRVIVDGGSSHDADPRETSTADAVDETSALDAGVVDAPGSSDDTGVLAEDTGVPDDATSPEDTGTPEDASSPEDAGVSDAGSPADDAGAPAEDAGTVLDDAGSTGYDAPVNDASAGYDAGSPIEDAGSSTDAGSHDAGVITHAPDASPDVVVADDGSSSSDATVQDASYDDGSSSIDSGSVSDPLCPAGCAGFACRNAHENGNYQKCYDECTTMECNCVDLCDCVGDCESATGMECKRVCGGASDRCANACWSEMKCGVRAGDCTYDLSFVPCNYADGARCEPLGAPDGTQCYARGTDKKDLWDVACYKLNKDGQPRARACAALYKACDS